MVFVKVRETYDIQTAKNKMTVISIHTPKPDIIKANFPGLLLQCKAYRPVSADVRLACASVLPVDPLQVSTNDGDVSPEDMFNPILYKACSNFGMSQLEARINYNTINVGLMDVKGQTADVDVDSTTTLADEFPVYYGLLSNAHEWRHASPQAGLEMTGLRPLVYEMLYNVGDQARADSPNASAPAADGSAITIPVTSIKGNAKPIPFINTTSYGGGTPRVPGFVVTNPVTSSTTDIPNFAQDVPWINCVVGCIVAPPSRLHEFYYRMVVEWTIEFSSIRPLSEVTSWAGLSTVADLTHYQNYSYSATKEALTGTSDSILEKDSAMVSSNVDIKKVM